MASVDRFVDAANQAKQKYYKWIALQSGTMLRRR